MHWTEKASEGLRCTCQSALTCGVQALVAGVAASGEQLGAADRAALAELVQRAAAARGAPLPGAEQARICVRLRHARVLMCCRAVQSWHGCCSRARPSSE